MPTEINITSLKNMLNTKWDGEEDDVEGGARG